MIIQTSGKSRCRRLAVAASALATVLIALVIGPAGRAAATPTSCTLGAYLISLSKLDTAPGSFDADFWMWSLYPDSTTEPLKSLEFVNGIYRASPEEPCW